MKKDGNSLAFFDVRLHERHLILSKDSLKKTKNVTIDRCNKPMKQIRSVIFIQTEAGYPVLCGLALSGA